MLVRRLVRAIVCRAGRHQYLSGGSQQGRQKLGNRTKIAQRTNHNNSEKPNGTNLGGALYVTECYCAVVARAGQLAPQNVVRYVPSLLAFKSAARCPMSYQDYWSRSGLHRVIKHIRIGKEPTITKSRPNEPEAATLTKPSCNVKSR